jgi:hypothetical protein
VLNFDAKQCKKPETRMVLCCAMLYRHFQIVVKQICRLLQKSFKLMIFGSEGAPGVRLFKIFFAMGKIRFYFLIVAKRSFKTIHSSTETLKKVIVDPIFTIAKKVLKIRHNTRRRSNINQFKRTIGTACKFVKYFILCPQHEVPFK